MAHAGVRLRLARLQSQFPQSTMEWKTVLWMGWRSAVGYDGIQSNGLVIGPRSDVCRSKLVRTKYAGERQESEK